MAILGKRNLLSIRYSPGLEGSAHINLGLAAQFIANYFTNADSTILPPPSVFAGQTAASENSYLMQAAAGHTNTIRFSDFLAAFRPLKSIRNVRLFAKQTIAFRQFVRGVPVKADLSADTETALAVGGCLATIAYGRLIAENCMILNVPPPIISAIFHNLIHDLSVSALATATLPRLDHLARRRIRRLIVVPDIRGADWDAVAERFIRP